ncbi:DUF1624 domain-containing protein [Paraglaciecola aestuariivivens]
MHSKRIESLDMLRGLVIVLMALDHVRDYIHLGAFLYDPTDLETTTGPIFATRWITHLCAPIFVYLAGMSAYLYASKVKSQGKTAQFLLTRGLWLIFLECTLITFLWTFDPSYNFINLQVIWAIGFSMLALSALIYLPIKWLLLLSLVIIFGHNLLDSYTAQGSDFSSILWYLFHQSNFIQFSENFAVAFSYPVLPWIGVMVLGYCSGQLYTHFSNTQERQKMLRWMALGMLLLFVLVRYFNLYGDLKPWEEQASTLLTFMSYMNVTKYPPSLVFILVTLGLGLLFLAYFEAAQNKITHWLVVYGRVPFLFYILHLFLAHFLGNILAILQGGSWSDLVMTSELFESGKLLEHGVSLPLTYLVWIAVVLILYWPCKQYHAYRANNPQKWYLKYL